VVFIAVLARRITKLVMDVPVKTNCKTEAVNGTVKSELAVMIKKNWIIVLNANSFLVI
jgi:hypothetical protein